MGFSAHGLPRRPQFSPAESLPGVGRTHGLARLTPETGPPGPSGSLSRSKTLPISFDYMLPCMLLRARSRDLLSCGRQAPGGLRQMACGGRCLAGSVWRVACGVWRAACGVWHVACGRRRTVAEIMTSVDIIV